MSNNKPPRCPTCNGIVKEDGQAYNWELTVEHPGRFDDAPWYGWRCTACQELFDTEQSFAQHLCPTKEDDSQKGS